jgi:hypothetical protein
MATRTFAAALGQVVDRAKAKLPEALHGRLTDASALVDAGAVSQDTEGHWQVASTSTAGHIYTPNGSCACQDLHCNKPQFCKHQLAVMLARRTQALLAADEEGSTLPAPEVEDPAASPAGMDPTHVVLIQGKPFVKYAGLLQRAHQRGLHSLTVEWTYNDAELSLAHAVAVFAFGTFEESGDSTVANVGTKVALHWRRMSLTRAKSRCLRDALGIDAVAVEELGREVEHG